jgi:hypothetical protein
MSTLREALCETRIAMRVHKNNPEALQAALNRLLLAHGNDVEALSLAGLMAPLADDARAWRVALHRLGNRGDPALGWIAYHKLLDHRPRANVERAWFHLVEASARRGYLPAMRMVTEAEAPEGSFLRRLYLAPYRLWWSVLTEYYAWHDHRDLRLPPSRRRQLG